jgi:hypothetical protein
MVAFVIFTSASRIVQMLEIYKHAEEAYLLATCCSWGYQIKFTMSGMVALAISTRPAE